MPNIAQLMLNNGIRNAIEEFDLETARQSLKSALKLKPDADTYYLASMLAETEKEKLKYLEKALDKDPFHEEAFAEYEYLTKQAVTIQKNTKPPKKPKTPKKVPANNWSAACYQLGYFLACGAGIVATVLGAPLIAVGIIVIVGGAFLGTVFKSFMAEHRITETLMDEASEDFRATRRGDSPIKKGTDFMQTTAGRATTAVIVTAFAATAINSSVNTPMDNNVDDNTNSQIYESQPQGSDMNVNSVPCNANLETDVYYTADGVGVSGNLTYFIQFFENKEYLLGGYKTKYNKGVYLISGTYTIDNCEVFDANSFLNIILNPDYLTDWHWQVCEG